MLFLPGWGFDSRLIQLFNLFQEETLLVYDSFLDPRNFKNELLSFLENAGCRKVKIVGWSMGANLGLDFSLSSPDRVAVLELVAMRRNWPGHEVSAIRHGIETDLKKYMQGFYRKCFLGCKAAYVEFQEKLQENYLNMLDRDILFSGLDYLENFSLPYQLPEDISVSILHGRKDVIAPVEDRIDFSGANLDIFPHAGHMVLLDRDKLLK
ncbi:MAG: alpha/beta hydrolase [Desulfobulbaceae bacterium]|nr:alpha/beta hydrolase [Desulfobulbaceae bacterium]